MVAHSRIAELTQLLGAAAGSNVLGTLAAYHREHHGQISDLMRSPEIGAEFDNWHTANPQSPSRPEADYAADGQKRGGGDPAARELSHNEPPGVSAG